MFSLKTEKYARSITGASLPAKRTEINHKRGRLSIKKGELELIFS